MRTKRHFVGWKYDTGSPGSRYHEADTLAAAIRDAGVRCETCEHFTAGASNNVCADPDTPAVWASNVSPRHDFFCAHHSALTKPSEGKDEAV